MAVYKTYMNDCFTFSQSERPSSGGFFISIYQVLNNIAAATLKLCIASG